MNANGEVKHLVDQEGPLLQHIRAVMNTLRMCALIPNFYNYSQTEAWWKASRHWTDRQKEKYKAWFEGLYRCTRDKDDKASVHLFLAYLIQEKAKRANQQIPNIFPVKYGVSDAQHAERIREYVRSHFEALAIDAALDK